MTPRLCGRRPSQRVRPALPSETLRVLAVADLADGRAAVEVDPAHLARGQADLRLVAFLGHQLRRGAGRAHQLRALADLQLDVVDHRADRDEAQRQRVAGLDVGVARRDDRVADREAVGREDVALLAVGVVERARCARCGSDRTRSTTTLAGTPILLRLKSIDAVALLVTAAAEARGDAAVVVAAAVSRLALE